MLFRTQGELRYIIGGAKGGQRGGKGLFGFETESLAVLVLHMIKSVPT